MCKGEEGGGGAKGVKKEGIRGMGLKQGHERVCRIEGGGFIDRQKVKRLLSSCNVWDEKDARSYYGGYLYSRRVEQKEVGVKVKMSAKQA